MNFDSRIIDKYFFLKSNNSYFYVPGSLKQVSLWITVAVHQQELLAALIALALEKFIRFPPELCS